MRNRTAWHVWEEKLRRWWRVFNEMFAKRHFTTLILDFLMFIMCFWVLEFYFIDSQAVYWKSVHDRSCELVAKLCFLRWSHETEWATFNRWQFNSPGSCQQKTLHNLSRFNSDLSLTFSDTASLTQCSADVDFMWGYLSGKMGAPSALGYSRTWTEKKKKKKVKWCLRLVLNKCIRSLSGY